MTKNAEIKVGDKVAVTNWLAFTYVVTAIPRKNKYAINNYYYDPNGKLVIGTPAGYLTKGWKRGWKHNGSFVGVTFNPDPKEIAAHNAAVESSERWMCM